MADDFMYVAFTQPEAEAEEWRRIRLWFKLGFRYVHLRKPGLSREATEEIIQHIPAFERKHLTLHDYPELAVSYHTGFHTNSRHPVAPDGIAFHTHSCHSVEEAGDFLHCRYVTLSPIYPSISKPGYAPKSNLIAEYQNAKLTLPPVVALGGIDFDKIPELRRVGFAGAAMLGALYKKHAAIYNQY